MATTAAAALPSREERRAGRDEEPGVRVEVELLALGHGPVVTLLDTVRHAHTRPQAPVGDKPTRSEALPRRPSPATTANGPGTGPFVQ